MRPLLWVTLGFPEYRMTVFPVSDTHVRIRGRSPAAGATNGAISSLGRRILAWVSGGTPASGREIRTPIDKPFPFFGE